MFLQILTDPAEEDRILAPASTLLSESETFRQPHEKEPLLSSFRNDRSIQDGSRFTEMLFLVAYNISHKHSISSQNALKINTFPEISHVFSESYYFFHGNCGFNINIPLIPV